MMNLKNLDNSTRAEILVQALPYLKRYYGKTIVVKYGGNAMISDDLKEQVMEDIVLLSMVGIKVVLVHGGGPEMSDVMKKLGKVPEFVDGLRVTDAETIEIAEMVLAGKINKSLVNLIQMKGGKAVGLSGIDDNGYIPVVSTIGCDKKGNIFNIHGDTAAGKIAPAVNAVRLIMMTDIEGIMSDPNDPNSVIREMKISQAEQMIEDGIISGGMIPKVRCCIDALDGGVSAAVIIDGRVPHATLMELLTGEGAGTMFRKG